MTELSNRGHTLKSQLDAALSDHLVGVSPFTSVDFDTEDIEADSKFYINHAERRINNTILIHYYMAGVYLSTHEQRPHPLSRIQNIGIFLAAYFHNETEAIYLLEDVTPYQISRVSARERAIILETRPQRPPPTPEFTSSPEPIRDDPLSTPSATNEIAQGPHDPETGELWQVEKDLYSPGTLWQKFLEDFDQDPSPDPPRASRKRSRSRDSNNDENPLKRPSRRPHRSPSLHT